MELEIYSPTQDGFLRTIEWNHEAIKKEIAEKVQHYATVVYTEDQIIDAKADRAKLRKFVDALETKRKEIKKQCLEPYETFEKQMKEIVSIVNKPILMIDGQVKAYEDSKKTEKLDAIKEYFNSLPPIVGFESLSLEQIFDAKWLNSSVSMKSIEEAISSKCGKIVADLTTLASMPQFSFEATEVYKDTLDINKAISEGCRLSEMYKRKEEAERLKTEQEKATVSTSPEDIENVTNKHWVSFSALLSTEDAIALREFFHSRNIEYKAVKE